MNRLDEEVFVARRVVVDPGLAKVWLKQNPFLFVVSPAEWKTCAQNESTAKPATRFVVENCSQTFIEAYSESVFWTSGFLFYRRARKNGAVARFIVMREVSSVCLGLWVGVVAGFVFGVPPKKPTVLATVLAWCLWNAVVEPSDTKSIVVRILSAGVALFFSSFLFLLARMDLCACEAGWDTSLLCLSAAFTTVFLFQVYRWVVYLNRGKQEAYRQRLPRASLRVRRDC